MSVHKMKAFKDDKNKIKLHRIKERKLNNCPLESSISPLASAEFEGQERFNLLFSLTSEGTWVGVKSHNFFIESGVLPLQWNHFCFAHSYPKRSVQVVQNGRIVLDVGGEDVFDGQFMGRGEPSAHVTLQPYPVSQN